MEKVFIDKIDFSLCYKKLAPVFILKYLYENTDKNHCVTRQQICNYFKDHDFPMGRRMVSSHLKALKYAGFDIAGVNLEGKNYDENLCKEDDLKDEKDNQGNVYLDTRCFNDLELRFLKEIIVGVKGIDNKTYNNIINKINNISSPTLKEEEKGIIKITQKLNYKGLPVFTNLKIINEAISQNKKIGFFDADYNFHGELENKSLTKRVVSPYYVAKREDRFCLIGLDHKNETLCHIYLDRMEKTYVMQSTRMDIHKTLLKDVNFDDYVLSHPYLREGKSEQPVDVVFKINKDNFSEIINVFCGNYSIVKEGKNHYEIKIKCAKNDALKFALSNSSFVEVLHPQEIREEIRFKLNDILNKYNRTDRDLKAIKNKIEEHKTKLRFEGVKQVKRLNCNPDLLYAKKLSLYKNELSQINFLEKCEKLTSLSIEDNPIDNLDSLRDRNYVDLTLKDLPINNLNFLTEMKQLKNLTIEKLPFCHNFRSLLMCEKLKNLTIDEKIKAEIEPNIIRELKEKGVRIKMKI